MNFQDRSNSHIVAGVENEANRLEVVRPQLTWVLLVQVTTQSCVSDIRNNADYSQNHNACYAHILVRATMLGV